GIDVDAIIRIKEIERQRIYTYLDSHPDAEYIENGNIWDIPCDIAMPCATQNELEAEDAQKLVDNGCLAVCEGANMPSTPEAIKILQKNNVAFAPGKAANAGGVASSALEMQLNATHSSSYEYSEDRLHEIMNHIHKTCCQTAEEFGEPYNYVMGANIAGFRRVANAMLAFGLI
ncbi:MAG TPA: glutamate dehydrogenase, partial [Methylophaga sp.]|nr:glutamate dehydrogenase [Methylophaga sp.]